jgi:hypothetical protein
MPVYRASMPDWLEDAERKTGRVLAARAATASTALDGASTTARDTESAE